MLFWNALRFCIDLCDIKRNLYRILKGLTSLYDEYILDTDLMLKTGGGFPMNVIYVDDERLALECFEYEARTLKEIAQLKLFDNAEDALCFARQNDVDAAFLDIEMPDMSGLLLAKALRDIHPDICIIFVTAYSNYALEAFDVDAIGYILKPYDREAIEHALRKAVRMTPMQGKRICIQTIPTFMMTVRGKPVHFSSSKSEELLALLVDRAGRPMMPGEMISCLWPERTMDEKTAALLRMTYRRLVLQLRSMGAEDILLTQGKRRSLNTEMIECDLYQILGGDKQAASRYAGEYLREYSWAEMTNAMLDNITTSNSDFNMDSFTVQKKTKNEEETVAGLYVRAFGSFQVFCNGMPLRFKYERSREMLAYLIDRNGAFCTKAELSAILFGRETGHDAYLKKLREDMINALQDCGSAACIITQRGRMAVNRRQLRCDYYDWLDGVNGLKHIFRGEYMTQYAWADQTRRCLCES